MTVLSFPSFCSVFVTVSIFTAWTNAQDGASEDAVASSVILPTDGIGSASASSPEIVFNGRLDISHFRYAGCLSAPHGADDLNPFTLVEEWEHMNVEQCISDCYQKAYAGVFESSCYCADSIDALIDFQIHPDNQCQTPCPGPRHEMCGGRIEQPSEFARRQDGNSASTILLTVYENTLLLKENETEDNTDSDTESENADFSDIEIRDAYSSNNLDNSKIEFNSLPDLIPRAMETITPTIISTTYTTICSPPLCIFAYPSETATTISILSTDTFPVPTLTVPMSSTVVTYTPDTAPDPIITILSVPDVSAIEELSTKVSIWIAAHPTFPLQPVPETSPAVDTVEINTDTGSINVIDDTVTNEVSNPVFVPHPASAIFEDTNDSSEPLIGGKSADEVAGILAAAGMPVPSASLLPSDPTTIPDDAEIDLDDPFRLDPSMGNDQDEDENEDEDTDPDEEWEAITLTQESTVTISTTVLAERGVVKTITLESSPSRTVGSNDSYSSLSSSGTANGNGTTSWTPASPTALSTTQGGGSRSAASTLRIWSGLDRLCGFGIVMLWAFDSMSTVALG